VLTLRLASGKPVEGLVDEATAVECSSDDYLGGDDLSGNDDSGDDADESGDDVGDDSADDDSDDASGDDEGDCAIEPGAYVHDAELELIDGELVFTLVELVG
jgi:hypothetical protein